jgi:hypothetical protein
MASQSLVRSATRISTNAAERQYNSPAGARTPYRQRSELRHWRGFTIDRDAI